MLPGATAAFRLRLWLAADGPPEGDRYSSQPQDLRATALRLLRGREAVRAEIAVWNIELNDWVRLERLVL